MLNSVGYTFDAGYWASPPRYFDNWDSRSVVVDPTTLAAVRGAASLILLGQEHEIAMVKRVRERGGVIIFNGAPITKTWYDTFKPSDVIHFFEDGEQCRARFNHLSTPIGFLRGDGQTDDDNPKYADTCSSTKPMATCIGQNILANLDYGVLSFLYDGLFHKDSAPNVLMQMFPITIVRIEPRIVWGTDRIITAANGTFGFANVDGNGYPLAGVVPTPVTLYMYLNAVLVKVVNVTASKQGFDVLLLPGVSDMAIAVSDSL